MSGLYQDFLDGFDVIAEYDKTIKNLIYVPISVPYVYTDEELRLKSISQLQDITTSRSTFSGTENVDILISGILNSQRIPVTFASPSTTWSSSEYVTGTIEPSPEPNKSINFSYPAIAVTRTGLHKDPNRYFGAKRRKIAWTNDGNAVLQSKPLIPIVIDYQIDAVALSFQHANMIDLSILRIFGIPFKRVPIDHGSPWGTLPINIYLDPNVRDASRLEASIDQAEKIIRHVYTITLEGWITTETQMIRTVRTMRTDFIAQNFATGNEDLLLTKQEDLVDIYSTDG